MSYNKLRGKIREKYKTQKEFSTAIGINAASLSAKLNGKYEWSRSEIEKACTALEIQIEEVYEYFFA